MRFVLAPCLLLIATFALGQSDSARVPDFVRQVLEKQKQRPNWFNTDPDVWPYAYEKSVTTMKVDGKGKVESQQSKKFDIVPITIPPLPFHYRHITTMEIDGKPVPADKDEARKSSEELLARIRKKVGPGEQPVTAKPSPKGQRMLDKESNENVLFWQEFQKAFLFSLLEHRQFNGRPVSVFATRPDPAYRPAKDFSGSAQFSKFTGEIWIDDADVEIVRFKYELHKDISGGPFGMLGKAYGGSWFQVDLTKQYKDTWLPSRTQGVIHTRKLFDSTREESIREFSNYREFTTTATFTPVDKP
jgi:hypothetical protein